MTHLLSTTGYDHVVVIDTQVVLEAKPLHQLPWNDLFPGSILLLLTRQVQSEIDAKKNDGRLGKRARAFNKLVDGFIETRVPSSVVINPKVDVATMSNRRIDWDMLDDLDRDDGDDRIVAQTLNAIVDDPGRLVLLSHDMRPRDAAQSHGLAAKKLPESWLREPEPSPDQRRINDLQDRVRLLSLDQPELAVRLEVVTPQPWRYLKVAPPMSEEVSWVLGRLLAQVRTQSRRGPFNIPSFDFDPTHDDHVGRWEDDMRREVPLMHEGMARQLSSVVQFSAKVGFENSLVGGPFISFCRG